MYRYFAAESITGNYPCTGKKAKVLIADAAFAIATPTLHTNGTVRGFSLCEVPGSFESADATPTMHVDGELKVGWYTLNPIDPSLENTSI